MICRACKSDQVTEVVDLGLQPLPNNLRPDTQLPQMFHPLRMVKCENCGLFQTDGDIDPEHIFNDDYPYFSSTNAIDYWKSYAEWITHYHLMHLGNGDIKGKRVLEIASNDGYLLKHFPPEVETLGYEPCRSVADKAREVGVRTVNNFFTRNQPYEDHFDVVIGNNVLAHTPDPVGMLHAAGVAVKPEGSILFEFPHAYQLFKNLEWDTIYHEHYSYFSVEAIRNLADMADLKFIYAMKTPIHGGSIRALFKRTGEQTVDVFEEYDTEAFGASVEKHKRDIQRRVGEIKNNELSIAGFGAAAKAATMINYCGIANSIDYIVDETEYKQGKYLAGTNIPIVTPEKLISDPPDYLWIFPWNFAEPIIKKLKPSYNGYIMTTKDGRIQCNHINRL